ncbi:bifunctional phosphoglucose/phosphomannose isomerase [Candidatus Microgenomates bacterium]|nr:bifunctional phosphoglucose/phosphomannose isomerase [Candidatus Microgenomates bacterium]
MANLDDIRELQGIDTGKTYESILFLPDQCQAVIKDLEKMIIPQDFLDVSSLVFCGMGGSAYGGRIIKSLYSDALKIPVDLVSDYHLPAFVNSSTLVIAASYSGNTEETVTCLEEACRVNAKVIGICSGGKIADITRQSGKPCLVFSTVYNPSEQPRLGQGYMQAGQVGLLIKLGLLPSDAFESNALINELRNENEKLSIDKPAKENHAKKLAKDLENKIPIMLGGEFLEGAIHAVRNPFHETGKHFAEYFILPEANHHLMEGLSYPLEIKKSFVFIFVTSDLYSEQLKKRITLTKEVVRKNGFPTLDINLKSKNKLNQVFELIQLGSFLTFYLAMLHDLDPVKIPWVDYFKKELKKEYGEK